jgi:threonine dehydratase
MHYPKKERGIFRPPYPVCQIFKRIFRLPSYFLNERKRIHEPCPIQGPIRGPIQAKFKINEADLTMYRSTPHIVLYCPACQRAFDPADGLFGCPGAGDGQEHILKRQLADTFDRPAAKAAILHIWADPVKDPFRIFQELSASRHILGARRYRERLDQLQHQLRMAEGKPFQVTPLIQVPALADTLNLKGRLWIKDETGNITGSHKGRHLMGSILYLEGLRYLNKETSKRVLAIYSCGNAALAASAVAKAGGYELHAFVPDSVETSVARMLDDRGAIVEKIPRVNTGGGDPCYVAFRHAIDEKKWVPFSCSGNDNWSNIDGGETLGAEMAMQLADHGATVTSLVIQVGGGALARAISQAWAILGDLGISRDGPRIYVCQAEGNHPFVRAYYLALCQIARHNGLAFDLGYDPGGDPAAELEKMRRFADANRHQVAKVVAFTRRHFHEAAVQTPLKEIVQLSKQFMWAWDGDLPASAAHGILDDLTYDWYHLLQSILKSGGQAIRVPEKQIKTAHRLAHEYTDVNVSPTGCAGLAGLLELIKIDVITPAENVGLFFTGIER